MNHISSWFDYVETRLEFDVLYNNFKKSLSKYQIVLGPHAVMSIEKIVLDLNEKHHFLFHYNFKGKTTFGFLGDSIYESNFSV